MQRILDHLCDGIFLIDTDKKIRFWNRTAETISGYADAEVCGSPCRDFFGCRPDCANDRCETGCVIDYFLLQGLPYAARIFLRRRNGERLELSIRSNPFFGKDGTLDGAVVAFQEASDSSEISRRVEDLARLAYLDPLTGLANRRYAEGNLSSRLAELRRNRWPFGLVMMDVDGFKQVNDRFGHGSGDRVLQAIASSLLASSRAVDTLGRWGGDEFIAVLSNVNKRELLEAANKFRVVVERVRVLAVDGSVLTTSISLGATAALPEDSIDTLVRRADDLLYESKYGGKNRLSADK
jgi:diguanylate cyclase (GGDEF)-like protein/PAS domain S-box-containing protein